jgi:hypothetical protein
MLIIRNDILCSYSKNIGIQLVKCLGRGLLQNTIHSTHTQQQHTAPQISSHVRVFRLHTLPWAGVIWCHVCHPEVFNTYINRQIAKHNKTLLKVKVKWFRYRPGVAQGVCTFTALLFHDRGTRRGESKTVPLQSWSGPEFSRQLRFPDFMTTEQDGGKVVTLTYRPPLYQEMSWYSFLLQAESTTGS